VINFQFIQENTLKNEKLEKLDELNENCQQQLSALKHQQDLLSEEYKNAKNIFEEYAKNSQEKMSELEFKLGQAGVQVEEFDVVDINIMLSCIFNDFFKTFSD